jgi:hypothetical protein
VLKTKRAYDSFGSADVEEHVTVTQFTRKQKGIGLDL